MEDELAEETEKLMSVMKPILEVATRDYPALSWIKGYVRFNGRLGEGVFKFQFSRFSSYIDNLGLQGVALAEETLRENFVVEKASYGEWNMGQLGFYVMGNYLDTKEIVKWLNVNLLGKVEKSDPVMLEDLSTEFKKDFEYQNKKKDLGDSGVFFDGNFFRDVHGKPLAGHPNRDKLFADHLEEENRKIGEKNVWHRDNEKLRRKFYQGN